MVCVRASGGREASSHGPTLSPPACFLSHVHPQATLRSLRSFTAAALRTAPRSAARLDALDLAAAAAAPALAAAFKAGDGGRALVRAIAATVAAADAAGREPTGGRPARCTPATPPSAGLRLPAPRRP